MCWSFEVSVVTGTIVLLACPYLWLRRATRRDRWNAIFLFVFGSMQWVDAAIWYTMPLEQPKTCSPRSRILTFLAFSVICMEPFAALAGRVYGLRKWCSLKELLVYIVCFMVLTQVPRLVKVPGCVHSACTKISPMGFLLYSPDWRLVSGEFDAACWYTWLFWGEPSPEIPVILRAFFLIGMMYPLLWMKPALAGMMHASVLATSWMIGYFTDAHASMWCLVNVAQSFFMIVDPFLFPLPVQGSPVQRKKRDGILQDRYLRKKVPTNLDAIVVGSGIGGLSTAALMSKAGKRVLVLEQHYRSGGCTHAFDEVGGNLFDSGIHYVGSAPELRWMLDHIADKKVGLSQMGTEEDGFCYDEFDLGGGELIRYRAGEDALVSELVRVFPEEEAGIRKYMAAVTKDNWSVKAFALLKIAPDWLACFLKRPILALVKRSTQNTASEVVAQYVQDPRLRALLAGGQLIDWNLAPDRVSWWVVAAMMRYYLQGGFYPTGGSDKIAEAIIPTIEKAGGRVLTRARVSSIIFDPESHRAIGVRLENRDELFAKLVISGVGAENTYAKLLPEEEMKWAGLQRELPAVEPSNSHITAFISLDAPHTAFGLRAANIHSQPALPRFKFNTSEMCRAYYEKPFDNPDCLMTLTCPSAKDPEYNERLDTRVKQLLTAVRFPGVSNVLMLTEAKYEWFEEWEEEEWGKRSESYAQFKKRFEGMFLERLFKYYPKTRGHVTHVEIGTPLTVRHFLAAPSGEAYGLAWTPERFSEKLFPYLSPKSSFPGLYLTGEASFFGGLAGALSSGFITAYKVLGAPSFLWTLGKSQPPSQ